MEAGEESRINTGDFKQMKQQYYANYPSKVYFILFIVIFIGFLGISLPYPIITPMILSNDNSFLHLPVYFSKPILLGIVISVYPFGQFIGSPILGGLSDRKGRRITLLLTLVGTGIGYLLSALAVFEKDFYLFFFSRLWTGFYEGNVAIAQSAITDLEENGGNKTKGMSWINSAVAVGFIAGPILGGGLTKLRIFNEHTVFSLPFLLAAFLCFLSIVLLYFFFNETLPPKKMSVTNNKKPIIRELVESLVVFPRQITSLFQEHKLKKALFIYTLIYIGIDLFYELYPFYFFTRWRFSAIDIALYSAVYTVPYMLSQLTLVQFVSYYFKARDVLCFIGITCGIGLFVMPFFSNHLSLYIILPVLGILISFCSTNIAVFLSDIAKTDAQGVCFGIAQSMRVFNNSVIAIIGGVLGSAFVGMPFFFGGVMIILASLLLIRWGN